MSPCIRFTACHSYTRAHTCVHAVYNNFHLDKAHFEQYFFTRQVFTRRDASTYGNVYGIRKPLANIFFPTAPNARFFAQTDFVAVS